MQHSPSLQTALYESSYSIVCREGHPQKGIAKQQKMRGKEVRTKASTFVLDFSNKGLLLPLCVKNHLSVTLYEATGPLFGGR